MTGHALLSPSAASRWFKCPASVLLSMNEPDKISEYAAEGTTAHALAEYCLKFNKPASKLVGSQTVANGIVVDEIMAEFVQTYVDKVCESKKDCRFFDVELKLDFTDLLDISTSIETMNTDYTPERSFGTADVVMISGTELQIHDLKYGQGVRVSAENNTQLMIYALAAYHMLNLVFEIDSISLHIHQPRLYQHSAFNVSVSDLILFGKQLKEKAAHVYRLLVSKQVTDSDILPGEVQCRFCKVAYKCNAFNNSVQASIIKDFSNVSVSAVKRINDALLLVDSMNNAELAERYTCIELITIWCNAVKNKVFEKLNAGEVVPGYKLVAGRLGNRKWADEAEAESTLVSLVGREKAFKRTLASPAQALKLVKGDKDASELLESIVVRSAGAPTVVSDLDPRQGISVISEFSKIEKD